MAYDTTLLTAMVEEEETHDGFRSIKLSGEPYAAAIVAAVGENYHRFTGRSRPTLEDLVAKIDEKVTLLFGGENMVGASALVAREGTLFRSSRSGPSGPVRLGILPKGKRSKGYVVDESRVLDVFSGWHTPTVQALVQQVRDGYPTLRNLTQERLNALPGEGQMGEDLTLAVFGQWRMPDCVSHDAIWLIGEYWPEEDICDRGVLLIRPEHGTSEHGSVYGRQLLQNRAIGEIVDFPPIPYGDAIALCDLSFDAASDVVFSRAFGAAEVPA